MAEDRIDQLRENNPSRTHIDFPRFYDFRSQDQVAAAAQALRQNQYARCLAFNFCDHHLNDGLLMDWDPILDELAAREKLESVEVVYSPTGPLLPLFRDQFFQALQRNPNVRSLKLIDINFTSNNSEGLVSFLDGAQCLAELTFRYCGALKGFDAQDVAAALQRNNRLQRLTLNCTDCDFFGAIFRSLASIHSTSRLLKLSYHGPNHANMAKRKSAADALRQYLESTSATVRCMEVVDTRFNYNFWSPNIVRGLIHNTSVTEVAFEGCSIGTGRLVSAESEAFKEEHAQLLASLVREKPTLSSLRFSGRHNFFQYQPFSVAVADALVQRGSSVRRLDLEIMPTACATANMPLPVFCALMTAICSSTMLEHLHIRNIRNDGYYNALRESISSFKVRELSLRLFREPTDEDEEGLLAVLKSNYLVQRVNCNWFTGGNQSRLDFYLDRNCKLAEWTKNPKLVPSELWLYAMMLALKAGINSLYQSLMALSGQGIGLGQPGRKRKRPQYYKP